MGCASVACGGEPGGRAVVKWWVGAALIGYLAVRYLIAEITLIP
jgi:hypothetical protein